MAKLGYLLLNKGKWEEQQLLPIEWVEAATTKQVNASEKYDYGYQFWIFKDIGLDNYFFRGSYPPSTKNIIVIPELQTVVAYVGENYKISELLRDFIIPAMKEQAS